MVSFVTIFCATTLTAQEIPAEIPQVNGQEQSFRGYLNGYGYAADKPAEFTVLSHPMRQEFAGGVGTYTNPITLAVGHVLRENQAELYFPAGTRFYLPRLRKYGISEDICDDTQSPQGGACHAGKDGLPWLSIFVDGAGMVKESGICADKVSGIQTFVMDPSPNYSVVVGELTQSGCNTFPDL